MATGISQLLEETTDEVLSCCSCHQEFQSPDRPPLDLPCHHAVCQQCVQQLSKDNRIGCPGCRQPLPVQDVLPEDTARLRLGYLKKMLKNKGEMLCEGGCTNPASSRCQECEELLCEEHCNHHREVTLTKKHTLVPMSEALKDPTNLLKWTEACREHEDEKLKFYCKKCQKTACSTCVTLHPKGCEMMKLEAVLEEKRKEVGEVTKRLKADISKFQSRASSASLEELDRRHLETKAEVQSLFAEGRKLLQEIEDQVLDDLKTQVKKARVDLKGQQDKDRSLLSAAQTRLQYGQRVASLGLSSQLLPGPQVELTSTCEDLERQAVAPATPVPLFQVDTSKMAELAAVVKEMGKIIKMPSAGKSSSNWASSQADSQGGSEREGGPAGTRESRSLSASQSKSVCASSTDPAPSQADSQGGSEREGGPAVTRVSRSLSAPESKSVGDSAPSQADSQDGSEREGGPSGTRESHSASQSMSVCVELLTVPRGEGKFREHGDQIREHLAHVLEKNFHVQIKSRAPGQKDGDSAVLILFQSQGRPGDEFPAAVPQELRGSSREVVVVMIQDDEHSSAGKDIVPKDVNCSGVVNVHVIPMQHELHKQGFSLCPRNQQAVREIAQLFHLASKRVEEPKHDKVTVCGEVNKFFNKFKSIGENTYSSAQPPTTQSRASNGTDRGPSKMHSSSAEFHPVPVELLLLPRSGGGLGDHLQKVGLSLRQELGKTSTVSWQDWNRSGGQRRRNSVVLIVFASQGSAGSEFPGAIPQELRDSCQRVVVAVIQDDENSIAKMDIVPEGVNCIGVVNVHVIPMQHELHKQGSSLCPRNQQAVREIARLLSH